MVQNYYRHETVNDYIAQHGNLYDGIEDVPKGEEPDKEVPQCVRPELATSHSS